MKYEALVARDFPGYKTVAIEAADDQDALRLAKEKFSSGELMDGGAAFDPQWDLPDADRIVSLTRADGVVLLEGWYGSSDGGQVIHGPVVESLARELREGAVADIWYDAKDFGDSSVEEQIETTQLSMELAASLLERQNEVLLLMLALLEPACAPGGIGPHEFSRPGGWRERAEKLVVQARHLAQVRQRPDRKAVAGKEVKHVG